jgi:hypothetical protein
MSEQQPDPPPQPIQPPDPSGHPLRAKDVAPLIKKRIG